jgi:hypothetical protein
MTPVVGRLIDTNDDEVVDEEDIPVVAYTTFTGGSYSSPGYLRVMRGDGSGEVFSVYSVNWGGTTYTVSASGGVAIGDLEGDGSPDLLVTAYSSHIIALESDGSVKWVSSGTCASRYTYPSIADLDGDGDAEIIAGNLVIDSEGFTLAVLPQNGNNISYAADLDGDGEQEIIAGGAVYTMDGDEVWNSGQGNGYTAVGNFDDDDQGEVLLRNGANAYLLDDDGSLIWSSTFAGGGGGAPAIGDLDGDGEMEVVGSGTSNLTAIDTDGDRMWTISVHDTSSGSAAVSVYDFDGDGTDEVLVADEYDLWIVDGRSGGVYLRETRHASGTIWENPVVADVDGDSFTEIVLATNNYAYSGWDGLVILSDVEGGWVTSGSTWNQHAFSVTNINDDSSVPADPAQPWLEAGVFRGQTVWADDPAAVADLSVEILGVCQDCDAGTVAVYVVVENQGSLFAPAGVQVPLISLNGILGRTILEVQTTPTRCEPGERLAPLVFTVDIDDIGEDGLGVMVNNDGSGATWVRECDFDNNETRWDALSCP